MLYPREIVGDEALGTYSDHIDTDGQDVHTGDQASRTRWTCSRHHSISSSSDVRLEWSPIFRTLCQSGLWRPGRGYSDSAHYQLNNLAQVRVLTGLAGWPSCGCRCA